MASNSRQGRKRTNLRQETAEAVKVQPFFNLLHLERGMTFTNPSP